MIQNEKGKWLITKGDILIDEDDMLIEDIFIDEDSEDSVDKYYINVYVQAWFDVDLRFGTSTHENEEDYVNFYVLYYPVSGKTEYVYYIYYGNGDVSDGITVDDIEQSEKYAIFAVMEEAGLANILKEAETFVS